MKDLSASDSQSANVATLVLQTIIFCLLVAMYLFNTEVIHAGIDFLYKVIFAAIIIVIAFVYALIKTNLTRILFLLRYALIFISPFIFSLVYTLPLWVINGESGREMRRGIFNQVYLIVILLAMFSVLYIYGKNGVWVNMWAMLGANMIVILRIIAKYGLATFLADFLTMLESFSINTTDVMREAEVADLTFGISTYIVYILVNWKTARKQHYFPAMFLLACFFFTVGLKRIALLAVIGSVIFYEGTKFLWRKGRTPIMLFSWLAVIAGFAYIALMRYGIYDIIEQLGIDTMGRKMLTDALNEYYAISPSFIGHGAGFAEMLFLNGFTVLEINSIQCDFLMIYLNFGFFGYWIWMILYVIVRERFILKWQGTDGALLSLCYIAFVYFTATTDNTIYMMYFAAEIAILTAGNLMDEEESAIERKIYHA